MKFVFSTKSENLKNLEGKIKNAVVLPQVSFLISEWETNSENIIEKIKLCGFDSQKLILRSSAVNEDSELNSLAGHYESLLNILGIDQIKNAISSLTANKRLKPNDQLFFQPQVEKPSMFGVAFSRNPNNNSPYIQINYDVSGSTTSITSGNSIHHKTAYIHRQLKNVENATFQRLVNLVFELEQIFSCDKIDIEFSLDSKGNLYLFQVRPLNIKVKKLLNDAEHAESVQRIADKIVLHSTRNPFNFGNINVYGSMPDWNPAEVIGARPRQLALSMYRELVTDSIWAYQRDNYGYKNLRSNPLLIEFEGMPYIDARVSFNSFIPKSLDSDVSEKLVNFCIKKLIENNALHDKIEFNIAYTCHDLATHKRIQELKEYGFRDSEVAKIRNSLIDLTNNIINPNTGLWWKDNAKIQILESHQKKILESDLDKISKMYWLIEDCKRYGTLPFAGLARAGFIAISFLKSFVEECIFTPSDYNAFLNSLDTISTRIANDYLLLSKEVFLEKYGHLRPGTYDIRSKRYDEAPDLYFDWSHDRFRQRHTKACFSISSGALKTIDSRLENIGILMTASDLLEFIRKSIQAREYSKFLFTKSISSFLKILTELTYEYQIDVDDASHLNIRDILSLYSTSSSPELILRNSIISGKEKHKYTESICLPSVIWDAKQPFFYEENESMPNFITNGQAIGSPEFISNFQIGYSSLNNKIILIINADPGYDWIFSHNISGLVTKYGGANSHMAIRAAELGIPAAIGIGEKFDQILQGQLISINCLEKNIRIIS